METASFRTSGHATASFNLGLTGPSIWSEQGVRVPLKGQTLHVPLDAPPGLLVRFGQSGAWIPAHPGSCVQAPRPFQEISAKLALYPWIPAPDTGAYLVGLTHAAGQCKTYAQALDGYQFRLGTEPLIAGDERARTNQIFAAGNQIVANSGFCLGELWNAGELAKAKSLVVSFHFVSNGARTNFDDLSGLLFRRGPFAGAAGYQGHFHGYRGFGMGLVDAEWQNVPLSVAGTWSFEGPFAPWDWLKILERNPDYPLLAAQGASQWLSIELSTKPAYDFCRFWTDSYSSPTGAGSNVQCGIDIHKPITFVCRARVSARAAGSIYMVGSYPTNPSAGGVYETNLGATGYLGIDGTTLVRHNAGLWLYTLSGTVQYFSACFSESAVGAVA